MPFVNKNDLLLCLRAIRTDRVEVVDANVLGRLTRAYETSVRDIEDLAAIDRAVMLKFGKNCPPGDLITVNAFKQINSNVVLVTLHGKISLEDVEKAELVLTDQGVTASAGLIWKNYGDTAAKAEGWNLFQRADDMLEIEMINEPEDGSDVKFNTDADAERYCYDKAMLASKLHMLALRLSDMPAKQKINIPIEFLPPVNHEK